jgi:hypothetical protein
MNGCIAVILWGIGLRFKGNKKNLINTVAINILGKDIGNRIATAPISIVREAAGKLQSAKIHL